MNAAKPAGGCHCGYTLPAQPRLSLLDDELCDPEPGDFHVCRACASVLILDVNGRWRPAEIAEIFAATAEARRMLAVVAKATATAIARAPRRGLGGMVN